MFYDFPLIKNITDVLPCIEGRDEFIVKHDEKNGLKFINYNINFEDTFPPVKTVNDAMRRECRGIAFYSDTGDIASRAFHKFFNLNERPETLVSNIDWSLVYDTINKIDGSFIRPILLRDGSILWGTKMGDTPVAEKTKSFIDSMPAMEDIAYDLLNKGLTPIFEFTSRSQRIVLDYGPEDMMRLIGVRDNITGQYYTYFDLLNIAEQYGVYVVGKLSGKRSIAELMQHTKDLIGEEGYVISFVNGHKVKIKAEHYCLLHKTIDHLKFEKDVIRLILDNKIDDAKPFLTEDYREALDKFSVAIHEGISETASNVYWNTAELYDNFNGSRKKFAQHINTQGVDKRLIKFMFIAFSYLENADSTNSIIPQLLEDIIKYLLQACNTQTKVDENRSIFGNHVWYNFLTQSDED